MRARGRGVAAVLGVALAIAALAAAIIFSGAQQLASGLAPRFHARIDYGEILPWLGFMLSGAAGMIWYSYWVQAKGYGTAAVGRQARGGSGGPGNRLSAGIFSGLDAAY